MYEIIIKKIHILINIIQLCEDIKAGKVDDVPFDFIG